jgi:hypothetical protein
MYLPVPAPGPCHPCLTVQHQAFEHMYSGGWHLSICTIVIVRNVGKSTRSNVGMCTWKLVLAEMKARSSISDVKTAPYAPARSCGPCWWKLWSTMMDSPLWGWVTWNHKQPISEKKV